MSNKRVSTKMVFAGARERILKVRRERGKNWMWYNDQAKKWYHLASTNAGAIQEFENLDNMKNDLLELEEKFNQPNT